MKTTAELKMAFGLFARASGFSLGPGYWFRSSKECIVTLNLQRSMNGPICYLNIGVFLQGISGRTYEAGSQDLLRQTGDVFRRAPPAFEPALALTSDLSATDRKATFQRLFDEFLIPFADLALGRAGVIQLAREGSLHLLPAVESFLSDHEN